MSSGTHLQCFALQEGNFLDGALTCCPNGTALDDCGICGGDGSACLGFLEVEYAIKDQFVDQLRSSDNATAETVAELIQPLNETSLGGFPQSNINITQSVEMESRWSSREVRDQLSPAAAAMWQRIYIYICCLCASPAERGSFVAFMGQRFQ
jgi:hypothetical protein